MLVSHRLIQTFLFVFLGSILFINKVPARELYNRHFSVRALGMGNAFIPLARGTDSLFFNPAGLAKTKDLTLTAFKIKAGINGTEAYENVEDFDGEDYADTLRAFYGDKLWLGGGGVTGFSTPNFAAAFYDSFNVSADLSNPALPSFQVDFINDLGIATGFGLDLSPGFSVGVAVKRIKRIGSSTEIDVSSLATLESEDLEAELDNRGLGYSLDFGASLTFPTPVRPTLSFVMRDIGNTKFTLEEGIRKPPTDKSEMIAALSLEIDGPGVGITPVFEIRHLAADETIHIGKKIHFGVEIDLPVLDLRGGLHQGYYTAGVGFDLGLLTLDLATYGVELGEYPGQHEDRRYVFELTMDFGFDPSTGSFLGLSKKNRHRLKQRR